MNIFKVADENLSPTWFDLTDKSDDIDLDLLENLNVNDEIDEIEIAQECEKIESCASNNKTYLYNEKWNKNVISHLKEYAYVCGVKDDKFKPVSAKKIEEFKAAKNNASMEKTASANVEEIDNDQIQLEDVWKDPFNIEKRADTSHMAEADWESVKKQNVMGEVSVMNNGIIPLRADEDYSLNPDTKLAKNQNSITNPNAIEEFINDKEYDNGKRLQLEKEEKEHQKIANHQKWEKDHIESMKHNDIVPKGTVFPTEMLTAATGISTPKNHMGVYAEFDADKIPDKTEGEKLAESNEKNRQAIQREHVKDDWEQPSRQSSRSISNDFAESLSKILDKDNNG